MTFESKFDRYVDENDKITCSMDGFDIVATVYRDDCGDRPDQRDDGFWPSKDPEAAGYVLPKEFDSALSLAKRTMAAWENDEWFYCGVAVTVWRHGVQLTGGFDNALWGIECNYPDSDNDYLRCVANELLPEALVSAKATIAKLCA